jgi:hypothetical protein
MDFAFSPGAWNVIHFEFPPSYFVFKPSRYYVFLDGTSNPSALGAYLGDPYVVTWLQNGGKLFVNLYQTGAGTFNLGVCGLTIDFGIPGAGDGSTTMPQDTHPIFSSETGTSWSSDPAVTFGTGAIVGPACKLSFFVFWVKIRKSNFCFPTPSKLTF